MYTTVDIKKLEHLSCLSLSESERESLAQDLGEMLAFVEALTEGARETSDVATLSERGTLREDIPREGICREELLGSSSVHDGEYFVVPCLLGGEKDA